MNQQPYIGMPIYIIPASESSVLVTNGNAPDTPIAAIVTAVLENGFVNAIAFPDVNMPVVCALVPHMDMVNEESQKFWHPMDVPEARLFIDAAPVVPAGPVVPAATE